MHCPVKVRDLLHSENKEPEIIYLTTPKPWNLYNHTRVPKEREDGWMEVQVSKFDLNRELDQDDCLFVNLKFISYEGTLPGLIVNGLEFRPAQTRCTLGVDDEEPLVKLGDDDAPTVADVAVDQGDDGEDNVVDVAVVANVVGITGVVVSDPVTEVIGGADTVLSEPMADVVVPGMDGLELGP
ncbi:uncharacterized protein [Rutidosis leptorrhynchoides]|uniref:uncharacterized protein n=1 Tax=Rutidosis leptorrhynchoides TaxID=125765 RepID=UPI003A99D867